MKNRHKPAQQDPFGQAIERRVQRRLRGDKRGRNELLFWLGLTGIVGWSIAVPTVLGILLGRWMDEQWPGPTSWVLTLLIVGVITGCLNAAYWVKREMHDE